MAPISHPLTLQPQNIAPPGLYIKPTLSFLLSFLPDEARTERNVEIFYHSCLTNHWSLFVTSTVCMYHRTPKSPFSLWPFHFRNSV